VGTVARGEGATPLPRPAIRSQTRAPSPIAWTSKYRIPRIAPLPVRCDYPQPNRERSSETPGGDFASVLGSATPASGRQGSQMTTKRNSPQRGSIETSGSHRRGTVERYLLRLIGFRPFRSLNSDSRFYWFAPVDAETKQPKLQCGHARHLLDKFQAGSESRCKTQWPPCWS
jgi:hypothetical protein